MSVLEVCDSIKQTSLDLVAGAKRWQLWTLLAWNRVRQKYRRSVIGPVWASLSFGIFVFSIGLLYARLFNLEARVYLPHFILGMLVWNLVSQVIMDACSLFSSMHGYIKEIKMPYTTFIFMMLWHNLIIFAFQFFVFILTVIIFGLDLSISWIYAFFGLICIILNALWLGIFFAVIAARYHDLIEIIGATLRILFFLTPILWTPGTLGRVEILLSVNPLYHFIEIFRANLLNSNVDNSSWVFVVILMFSGWILAMIYYNKYRDRVAFWI